MSVNTRHADVTALVVDVPTKCNAALPTSLQHFDGERLRIHLRKLSAAMPADSRCEKIV